MFSFLFFFDTPQCFGNFFCITQWIFSFRLHITWVFFEFTTIQMQIPDWFWSSQYPNCVTLNKLSKSRTEEVLSCLSAECVLIESSYFPACCADVLSFEYILMDVLKVPSVSYNRAFYSGCLYFLFFFFFDTARCFVLFFVWHNGFFSHTMYHLRVSWIYNNTDAGSWPVLVQPVSKLCNSSCILMDLKITVFHRILSIICLCLEIS